MKSHRDQPINRSNASERMRDEDADKPNANKSFVPITSTDVPADTTNSENDHRSEAAALPQATSGNLSLAGTSDRDNKAPTKANRTAILVLGMHRSGTSALTRFISLLGADLPEDLMPAVVGNNEAGFWESTAIWRLNDEILASVGSAWSDCRRFDPDWIRSASASDYKERALRILAREFSRSSVFVLKDPRICRFLPFWLEVLQEFDSDTRCAFALRNPLEVADSLAKRDGFSAARSHAIWLRHVLDAEFESRGLKRAIVSYDALLADWRGEARNLADKVGLAFRDFREVEGEIDQFLQIRYRSHAASDDSVFQRTDVPLWVKETFDAVMKLRLDPESKSALDRLDAVRAEFDRAADSLNAMFQAEALARNELKKVVATHAEQAGFLEQMALKREARIRELERARNELKKVVAAHAEQAGSLEQMALQSEARIREAGARSQRVEKGGCSARRAGWFSRTDGAEA